MNSPLLPYIIIWIGVVLAVAEHVHIVFNEWILAERHKRMPFAEVIGHLVVAIVLGVVGASLAKRALSPSTLFLAMAFWFAAFNIHDKHRSIVMALLRGAIAYSLRQGRINRAKTLGSRLFDLMIIERLVRKSRSAKWRFAKSAMVLAQMREILGDYPLAQRMYGWALSDLVEAGLTKKRNIRQRYLARAIEAGCGEVRVAGFRDPGKAASLLKTIEALARSGGADIAAKVVMVGGQISTLNAVTSEGAIADEILAKASFDVAHYHFAPAYESKYAAFLLASRQSERNETESALTISNQISRLLRERADLRDFFLWLRNEELRSALLERKNNHEEARSIVLGLTREVQERLSQIAEAGNEKELLSLSDLAVRLVTRLVGLTAQYFGDRSELVENAYDAVIALRGIAGSIRMEIGAALSINVSDALQNQARKAVEIRGHIAQRWTKGSSTMQDELDAIELEQMEAFLIRERLRDRAAWTLRDANIATIRKCLREGERLFEFVRTVFADGEPRYVMFTLSASKADSVRLTDLGLAVPIEACITQWRMFIQLGANPSLSEPNTAFLQTRVIDRMLTAGAAARWTIVTDGGLTSLPFEAVYAGNSKRLIEEHECAYVSTCSELRLRRRPLLAKGSRPIVVADPDYEYALHSSDDKRSSAQRLFERLPLAESEGTQVAMLVGGHLVTGPNATLGQLKAVASPRMLHIATHAFALDGLNMSATAGPFPTIPAWERLQMTDDAMQRAGLALAGVNAVLRGEDVPPEAESGVLSAFEASTLDLRSTDLVVLSACDTGLGQFHRGEGILGLRRGFSIAGARVVVISLWRVPDSETCDLMVDFYRGVMANLTFAQALRQAKLNVLRTHPQPLYWAAFVCSGDVYRPLN